MTDKVKKLISKPLEDINIKLCDVEYAKEGASFFLRIIIDKEPFVDIDTCVLATSVINPIIDKLEDEFDDGYILDVCSLEKGGKEDE